MDKQKKQLIALVALLVIAGGVALYMFVFKDSGSKTPAKKDTAKETPAKAEQPAGTKATPKGKADPKGAAKGAPAPVVQDKDEDIPPKEEPKPAKHFWRPDGTAGSLIVEPTAVEPGPFDPFRVKNVDIVNPELRKEIDELKQTWVPDGVTRTWQNVPVREKRKKEDGTEEIVERIERKLVIEAWFNDKRAPFKVNDRLTGTRYVIYEIVFGPDERDPSRASKALIRLKGDKGNFLDLELAPPSRYGDDTPGRARKK